MNNTKALYDIGTLIADFREKQGLTQNDLAKKIGTTQSAIARIEKGEQNISTTMLGKISNALKKDVVTLGTSAVNFKIEGGRKLHGSVTVKSSKNAAVALMCASLLNEGTTLLRNVPKIEEVYRLIEVLTSMGASVNWRMGDLEIIPVKIDVKNIDIEAAIRTRSIIMFIGSLVHLFKSFKLPQAGGCKLGSRTVRPHFYALEKLGIDISLSAKTYNIKTAGLNTAEVVLYESGDTVTENVLMAAAKIPGKTVIKFASANYQVQDLCFFLEKLGVKIEGIGTTTLTVHGKANINQSVSYSISEDPIEAMFFLSSAIITKSSIEIKRCPIDFLEIELLKLQKMGFRYKCSNKYKSQNEKTNLVDIKTYPSTLTALHDKIEARPYPGLNIDNLPFFAVIATQARGQTLIHDWVYEKRAIHYKELDRLGADTILADPHRFYVDGPSVLKPAEIICPPALRPAAIILIAMLAAKGTSILRNVYSINRGYEDLANRLNKLGAKIETIRS